MLNRFHGIMPFVAFGILAMVAATIVHANSKPVASHLSNESTNPIVSSPQVNPPQVMNPNNNSSSSNNGTTTAWNNPWGSGQVTTNPDGSTTTTWNNPWGSGQVTTNPDGTTTTTWNNPWSRGQTVSPR
jgi:hypothetical protein